MDPPTLEQCTTSDSSRQRTVGKVISFHQSWFLQKKVPKFFQKKKQMRYGLEEYPYDYLTIQQFQYNTQICSITFF